MWREGLWLVVMGCWAATLTGAFLFPVGSGRPDTRVWHGPVDPSKVSPKRDRPL
jgi:hypothetical protein